MGRSLFERLYKKSYFKACEGYKTATDAACESRECLHFMPSCEEEKPHLWVNLLEVNEDFGDKHNDKRDFLVSLIITNHTPLPEIRAINVLSKE